MSDHVPAWFDALHGAGRRGGDDDSPQVEIAGDIRASTDKAIHFYDGTRTVWLPRSQVTIVDDTTISLPEWLAKNNGLI